jgi:hypothetical protein
LRGRRLALINRELAHRIGTAAADAAQLLFDLLQLALQEPRRALTSYSAYRQGHVLGNKLFSAFASFSFRNSNGRHFSG